MKLFTLLPLLLLLIACSGETVTNRVIENNSDKDFKMVLYKYGIPGDTLDFPSGTSMQISVSTTNKGTDEDPDCVRQIDSAYTVIAGGGILAKKIEDANNWESETDKAKTLPPEYENSCVFSIQNSDIE